MFCNVCHTQFSQSSAFCPQCGTTLAPDSASETIVRHDLLVKQDEMVATENNLSDTTQKPYLYPPDPSNSAYNNIGSPQDYYNPVPQDPYYSVPPPPITIPPQSRSPKRGLITAIVLSIVESCCLQVVLLLLLVYLMQLIMDLKLYLLHNLVYLRLKI